MMAHSCAMTQRTPPVFDDLDLQPWRDLTHAYGSTKDVPRWLRQLTSSSEKLRVTALNDLYGSICHQNWNCPATAYTVPYVIELLQQPLVEQKAGLLEMLADIASCEPLNEADWRENKHVPSYNVPLRIPLEDAHTAVAEGIPTCITLLGAANLEVRLQAAHVLSAIPERLDDLSPALESALRRETAERGRADLTLALGFLSSSSPTRWRLFERTFEQSESDLLRFVAALVIVMLARQNTPEQVIHYLGDIAQEAVTPPSLVNFETLVMDGGEPRDRALSQLLFVGIARLTFLTGSVLKRAMSLRTKLGAGREPLTDWVTFNNCMEWLIFVLFGERAQTDMTLPPVASLTADQRDFLVFALQQGYWDYVNFTG
jgi:hypothetical protein